LSKHRDRITASPTAKSAVGKVIAKVEKKGWLGIAGLSPSKRRRREPSLPRVSILDNRPTPERIAKIAEGIEAVEKASGTGAHRIRSPLETHKLRFAPQLLAAAARYLRNRDAVETAAKVTADWSGMPNPKAAGSKPGGVHDARRRDAAELAYVEATLEAEFRNLMDLLAAGVEAHRSNQPHTVADIARTVLQYRGQDSATAAGVGMLWGALVRLNAIYVNLRAYDRSWSSPDEIAQRLMERRRKAATAAAQFHREAKADG
jgi:hypothetical protein